MPLSIVLSRSRSSPSWSSCSCVALRRSRAGRRTRDAGAVPRARSADLAARVETSLGRALRAGSTRVRRGQLAAAAVADDLTGARSTRSSATQTRRATLRPPPGCGRIRDGIVAELERASRALEMIEHGARSGVGAAPAAASSRRRPSLKRGYLNLLHAREAIARHAVEVRGAAAAAELVPARPDVRRVAAPHDRLSRGRRIDGTATARVRPPYVVVSSSPHHKG